VVSGITKGFKPFGRSESETDAVITSFIGELVPQLQPHFGVASD